MAGRSLEKLHAAGFNVVDRADELHAPFDLAFAAFGRFENLAHAPVDVGFDGVLEQFLGRETRIEIGRTGQDAIDEKLRSARGGRGFEGATHGAARLASPRCFPASEMFGGISAFPSAAQPPLARAAAHSV